MLEYVPTYPTMPVLGIIINKAGIVRPPQHVILSAHLAMHGGNSTTYTSQVIKGNIIYWFRKFYEYLFRQTVTFVCMKSFA